MSGGSFNYLCRSWGLDDLMGKRHDLEAMAEELARLGWAKDAALETRHLIADLNAIEVRVQVALERLRPVWKAVEWWRSCDWSEDQVRDALTDYRAALDNEPEGTTEPVSMESLPEPDISQPSKIVVSDETRPIRMTAAALNKEPEA